MAVYSKRALEKVEHNKPEAEVVQQDLTDLELAQEKHTLRKKRIQELEPLMAVAEVALDTLVAEVVVAAPSRL